MSDPDACRNCGHTHDSCDHPQVPECHNLIVAPCPYHFTELSQEVMGAVAPELLRQQGPADFIRTTSHIADDGYISAAYYTWMSMLGRWGVPDGADRATAMENVVRPHMPDLPHLPGFAERVLNLVEVAMRAAVVYDGANVEAAMDAAVEMLDGPGMLSWLASVAASAHVAAEGNDACTGDLLWITHMLGSQVNSGAGFSALPHMVDLVAASQSGSQPEYRAAFDALMAIPGTTSLVAAVDVFGRVIAQITDPNLTIITGEGPQVPDSMENITGTLAWQDGPLSQFSMPQRLAVVALRNARCYTQATSAEDALARVKATAEQSPNITEYVMDVLMGSAHLLADMLAAHQQD